jgi:hypothetical protein
MGNENSSNEQLEVPTKSPQAIQNENSIKISQPVIQVENPIKVPEPLIKDIYLQRELPERSQHSRSNINNDIKMYRDSTDKVFEIMQKLYDIPEPGKTRTVNNKPTKHFTLHNDKSDPELHDDMFIKLKKPNFDYTRHLNKDIDPFPMFRQRDDIIVYDFLDNMYPSTLGKKSKNEMPYESNDTTVYLNTGIKIINSNVQDVDETDENNQCVICFERKKIVTYVPCGHMSICMKCAKEYHNQASNDSCLVCFKKVNTMIGVYIV